MHVGTKTDRTPKDKGCRFISVLGVYGLRPAGNSENVTGHLVFPVETCQQEKWLDPPKEPADAHNVVDMLCSKTMVQLSGFSIQAWIMVVSSFVPSLRTQARMWSVAEVIDATYKVGVTGM